ncbi:MAG: NADH-quinone oxidoreductase subunit M, partial [Methyloligellaceae bacterium]
FLTLLGAFRINTWVAFFAATGVILSAAYALWLYRRVMFGTLEKPELKAIMDLETREVAIMAPLVALTIFFGVYPAPLLDVVSASVEHLIKNYETALAAAGQAQLALAR